MHSLVQNGSANRSSNFELIRILAAMGVIMHHVAVRAFSHPMPGYNRAVFILMYVFFICDVDVFVMISGYFMAFTEKISLKKPFELLLQLQVLRIVLFCIQLANGSCEFNIEGLILTLVPSDYFIMLYVALILIAPYINKVLNDMSEEKYRRFLLLVFLVFSVWNYAVQGIEEIIGLGMHSSTTVSQSGALGGRSIVNFVLCYIIGSGIRRKFISLRHPLMVIFACAFCNVLLFIAGSGQAADYLSPFTIIQSAAVIMWAEKLKLQSKAVNFIAKASLTVYIVHVPMIVAGLDYPALVEQPLIAMIIRYGLIVLCSYALGLVMHYAYHYLSRPLRALAAAKLEKIEISA